MRYVSLLFFLFFTVTADLLAQEGFAVVELFTSQGCSSCPPADVVLQELETEARASGKPIYALSFHVDYWNYLGWQDPFSSPYYSARQTDYTDKLKTRTYTPQIVINGKEEMIGSRRGQVRPAVARALATSVPDYGLSYVPTVADREVVFQYTLEKPEADFWLVALIVQDRATSSVKRGENRGKELSHVAVVRGLTGETARKAGKLKVMIPEGVDAESLSTLLLLQTGKGGAIRAVATPTTAR